ncbi:28885_t:CDS:1, partial [Racocetra persica]
ISNICGWVKNSWKQIPDDIIIKSFVKCGILNDLNEIVELSSKGIEIVELSSKGVEIVDLSSKKIVDLSSKDIKIVNLSSKDVEIIDISEVMDIGNNIDISDN